MNPFVNKVAWITGASSGIGRALAIELSKRQCKLILSARNLTALGKVKNECAHPQQVALLALDLEKSQEIFQAIEQALAVYGQVDYLFNNGGVSQRSNAFETSATVDRSIMEINFFSNIALAKGLIPHFRKQKSGYIIVTSSIAGKFGFYLRSTYSASKHALHGFYESLRMEEEENGIKVLMVCPGKIATDISLHALTGDGTAHNAMEAAHVTGIPASECAKQILDAIVRNREEVYIGGRELRSVRMKRWFPAWFSKLIKKQKRE